MKKRVLIAADVDKSFLDRIGSDGRFTVRQAHTASEESLHEAVGDCQILVTRAFNKVTTRVIEGAPDLELIAQGTSGIDNIDDAAAALRKIPILNVPGQNANAVAELMVALMILLTRTVPAYDAEVRGGKWNRGDCATRKELRSHRLGIVGVGRVGSRVAALVRGFGMAASGYDPYLTEADFISRGVNRTENLEDLLAMSDILTIHVPLTTETRGMMRGELLDLLPPGAIVLNACRGEVVDREELFTRLRSNALGGVALDVFDPEPPAGASWPDDPRLILTPHIAGCTREAKASIGHALYEKVCAHYGYVPVPA